MRPFAFVFIFFSPCLLICNSFQEHRNTCVQLQALFLGNSNNAGRDPLVEWVNGRNVGKTCFDFFKCKWLFDQILAKVFKQERSSSLSAICQLCEPQRPDEIEPMLGNGLEIRAYPI